MIGFENIQQEQEAWENLKKGYIPLKFGYVGKAVDTYDELASTESYDNAIRVNNNEYLSLFLKNSENINTIIDIGSGNGNYSSIFINELLQMNLKIDKYFCCDYSFKLSELCIKRLKSEYQHINFEQIIWDIEKDKNNFLLDYTKNKNTLVTFFGNTIGNIYDSNKVLENIYNSINVNDKLILEVSVRNDNVKPMEMVKEYRNQIFIDANTEVLRMMEIDTTKGTYTLYYDGNKEAIVGEFMFNENMIISYKDETIEFLKNDVISCFISKRYKKETLKEYIKDAGWTINNIIGDKKDTTLLFFCEKI